MIGYYGACMMGYYGVCMMGYYGKGYDWLLTMERV